MQNAIPFDAAFHRSGSLAASGSCSQHGMTSCSETPVISFTDRHGRRQSGCIRAADELSARGEITISADVRRDF